MRRRVFVVALVAAGFLAAGSASADRPATESERAAVERDIAIDPYCVWSLRISSVDSAWGRIDADPDECGGDIKMPESVVNLRDSSWFAYSWIGMPGDICEDTEPVPHKVADDLGLCHIYVARPQELLPCEDRRDSLVLYLHRPRRCDVAAPSQSYGLVVNLRDLRWRGWGSSIATARATESGRAVRVRAWRLRKLCGDIDGSRAYTRLRVSSRRGFVTMRRPAC